jgi:Neocarzinostatin family
VRVVRLLAVMLMMLGGVAFAGGPASADPGVSVTPSAGLAGGDTVRITAAGVTPLAEVQVIQCDVYYVDSPLSDCPGGSRTTADSAGRIATSITLRDPVYRRSGEEGDLFPKYCRADICRMFVVWTDAGGAQQVLSSDALNFTGSPATIKVTPSSGLPRTRRVAVSGTADGAQGRQVQIIEELCVAIIQGHGCDAQFPAVATTVRPDGSFAARYRVRRFVTGGLDCAGDISPYYCQVSAIILTAAGQPDYSFGDPTFGDPHGTISFRVHSPAG